MNIPNTITLTRFFFIPIYIYVFFSGWVDANLYAFFILLLAGCSDILDGYLARRNNQITALGQILDPLADKLMMMSVIITFLIDQRISLLAASIFVLRDVITILLMSMLHAKKSRNLLPANKFGKASTCLFYLSFLFLMFEWPFGQELLWVGLLFSFLTSFIYANLYFFKHKSRTDTYVRTPTAINSTRSSRIKL
ncbi:CDP-alcohol phosphatidyltransferase family protein [Bacillus horti]|uniref:CDP-diacylglycerol--glycerol-3-phosphate 3-phosphatidyltransferase n=1 Tax=Caldalkalibacillus horti TaxID=77523 RepID=A0ABT9W4Y1_9BACI|nr:CDP-alcohol phosphatidyltransferase family protein [Bacillus horti]MDQ0168313.1 cardiolipin synthase [Bacillus horti]